MNIIRQANLTPQEHLVVVPALVQSARQPIKAIQVQLTLETRHLRLLEVVWHDVLDKFLGLVYDEAPTVGLPRQDVGEAIGLNFVKHVMQLDGKRRDDAALGLVLDRRWVDDWVGSMIMVVMLHDQSIVMGYVMMVCALFGFFYGLR